RVMTSAGPDIDCWRVASSVTNTIAAPMSRVGAGLQQLIDRFGQFAGRGLDRLGRPGLLVVFDVRERYLRRDERRDRHPQRNRPGRSACRRAATDARLRRAAEAGGEEAGAGKAGPDA